MPLESMPTELIGEICDNLCYVDRKALFEASRGSLELRDDIEVSSARADTSFFHL